MNIYVVTCGLICIVSTGFTGWHILSAADEETDKKKYRGAINSWYVSVIFLAILIGIYTGTNL